MEGKRWTLLIDYSDIAYCQTRVPLDDLGRCGGEAKTAAPPHRPRDLQPSPQPQYLVESACRVSGAEYRADVSGESAGRGPEFGSGSRLSELSAIQTDSILHSTWCQHQPLGHGYILPGERVCPVRVRETYDYRMEHHQ